MHVAVVHYPEGAGHATRMMGVARELQRRGATVALAGGGDGSRLYAPNGYDAYEPPRVNYVDDYQDARDAVQGLARVLTGSVPDSARRVTAIRGWLRAEDPDAVVADGLFGAAAGATVDAPLYVLTHDAAAMYGDPVVAGATGAINTSLRAAARRVFCPTVWPPAGEDVVGASRVPPVALPPPEPERTDAGRVEADAGATVSTGADESGGPDGTDVGETATVGGTPDDGPADPGVVLVPSAYSRAFEALADRLASAGYDVTLVGGEDWTLVPSMLPVLRGAEAVVCSGYSTVMEAAVAGTHCVVCPATNEQCGVARRLLGEEGFTVARSPDEVERAVATADPPTPSFSNGAGTVAERVLDDLPG